MVYPLWSHEFLLTYRVQISYPALFFYFPLMYHWEQRARSMPEAVLCEKFT